MSVLENSLPVGENEASPATPVVPVPPPAPIVANVDTFRLMVEAVRDYGIFFLDETGVIRSWNLGAARLKGYQADEIVGHHFSIFYTQEDRDRRHPEAELAIARVEGRYEEEGWRVRKDGSRFWANVLITRITDANGTIIGFGKVTRDLTERKAAEDALRASEEQARLVYQTVKDYSIITLDRTGHITGWNEGARRIKGYGTNEILGRHFSIFYEEEEISSGKCEYELEEAAITGRFEDEGWRVRKDGTRFWANIILTALYDKNRQLRGFSKVTRDMTERKRAEDRLRMANENLERRVQERTTALSTANEGLVREVNERKRTEQELQQAIRARDEFLSIASHELRTPITPLKLQLQGIINQLRRGTLQYLQPEKMEKMASTLDRSLNRLTKLIDNLLDVSRISAGRIALHPEHFDAAEITAETVLRFGHEARLAGCELRLDPPSPLEVDLDRTRFEQVLSNLVVNAIKFGNAQPIDVRLNADETHLCLEVQDHGVGIPEGDQARIFQRFEQLGPGKPAGGLGLGLYIVRQIVDAQHGTISVRSAPGRGTTFCVRLPLSTRHLEQKL